MARAGVTCNCQCPHMRSGCNSGVAGNSIGRSNSGSGCAFADTVSTVTQFQLNLLPTVGTEAHFFGDLPLEGSASELGSQRVGYRIYLLLALAQIARGPIELPQAVEYRTLDVVFGVSVERYILLRVVFRDRIEEAEHTGVRQIVQIHGNRGIFMHPDGNRLHQR
jgi:hypothetical protein